MLNKNNFIVFIVWAVCLLLMTFPIRTGFHFWDEAVYLQHADIIAGDYNNYNEFDSRPPLFSLILALSNLIYNSLIFKHLIVSFISSLGVFGVFFLGKELYDERTGLISSVFYLFLTLIIELSHNLLVDAMLPVFILFSTLFFIRAFKKEGNINYAIGGALYALAILLKFTAISYGLIFVLIYFTMNGKSSLRKAVKDYKKILLALSSFVSVLSPYLIYSQVVYGSFFATIQNGRTIVGWGIPTSLFEIVSEFHKLVPYPLIALFFFGVIFVLSSKKISDEDVILWICVVIPFLLQFNVVHREVRYFTHLAPFIIIFSSKFVNELFKLKGKIKYLSLSLIVVLFIFSFAQFYERYESFSKVSNLISNEHSPGIMQAGIWLKNNSENISLVYTNCQWPVIAYYSKREIQLLPLFRDFYSEIEDIMIKKGYYVICEESKDQVLSLNFSMNDKRFSLLNEFGLGPEKVYVFYYNPINSSQ